MWLLVLAMACNRPPPPTKPPPPEWQSRMKPDERALLNLANEAVAFCEKRVLDNQEQVERWCGRFARQREWLRCKRDHLECADVDDRCARAKASNAKTGCKEVVDGAAEIVRRLESDVKERER